jgi:hypothetical protein
MARPNPPRDFPQPICGQRAIFATLYLLLTERLRTTFLHPPSPECGSPLKSLKILIAALSSSVAY